MYRTEQHSQPWLLCSNHYLSTSLKHAGIFLIICKQFSFQFREEEIFKKIDENNLKDNSGFKNDTFMLAKQKATEKIAGSLERRTDFNGYSILLSSIIATLGVQNIHFDLHPLHLGSRSSNVQICWQITTNLFVAASNSGFTRILYTSFHFLLW